MESEQSMMTVTLAQRLVIVTLPQRIVDDDSCTEAR